MPAHGFSPRPRLLLSSLAGILLGAGAVQAESPFSTVTPSTFQAQYLAQLDDDDFDHLDDDLEDEIDALDDDIEDQIGDDLEDEIDDELEDALDDLVEDAAEDALDDEAEDLAEEAAEDQLEDSLDDDAEDLAEELAEETAEDRLDEDDWGDKFEDLNEDRDDELNELNDDELNDGMDRDDLDERFDDDDHLAEALEERLLDALEDDLDNLAELNSGNIIVRNQMLVVADDALLDRLAQHPDLELKLRQPLSSLGLSLGRFNVPSNVALDALRAELRQTYPGLSVDFNHGYELSQSQASGPETPIDLSELYRPPASGRWPAAIGMLDGPVTADHPVFADARLEQKAFAAKPSDRDRAHGTAVASLLVGRAPDWEGMAPDVELHVASVFSEQPQYGSIATTQSLITALDWLASQPVAIINISLAGPPNQTLETVLQRVRARGIVPVAAAGNAGPLAEPHYPAAYPTVVAVTAIDRERSLYRYAGRGDHLDFAAFGVNVIAASGDRGFEAVTGTSFAAPVVTALLARYLIATGTPEAALEALAADTLDLGEPGKDLQFGQGLPGESQLHPAADD